MKIVDVCESFSTHGGGVRTYVLHKLAAAQRAGHDVTIVAPGAADRVEPVPGGRILWIAGPRSPVDRRYGWFADERAIHRVLAAVAPDLVEASSPWNAARFVARWDGSAPRVLVFHTDPVAVWAETFLCPRLRFDRVDRWCAPWWRRLAALSHSFSATITSGSWLARRIADHGLVRAEVVPFGIDKAAFSPTARDPALRDELLRACGRGPDATLLVAVGRLDPEKRIDTVLDGVARAGRSRPLGLVVVGRGSLARWVQWRARRMAGVHHRGWLGDRTALARLLASADAFVHGSGAETYGLAVAEAICSGLPVVAPDRGGAAALVRPSFAESYPTGDASGCAAAIERLLARDHASLVRAAAAASAGIVSIDEHFDRLFARYAELVRGRTQRTAA